MGRAREEKVTRKEIREEKESDSQTKEDAGAQKGRKSRETQCFAIFCGGSKSRLAKAAGS